MDKNEKNTKNERSKETLSNFWQKTSDITKKAADGAKSFAEQTKKNIYDAQAKKYTPVTAKEFKSKSFDMPNIIKIVDDSANRKFVTCEGAIGWIEKREGIDALHMYGDFVKKCGIQFIPLPQQDNVYCKHNFDNSTFINSNQVFGKATEEKLSELSNIAFCLGAKSFSVEIVEADMEINSKKISANHNASVDAGLSSQRNRSQSGKNTTHFEGSRAPKKPTLKWFAHDDNIKNLIDMRCSEEACIKSSTLELKGSSSATMSVKIACALDNLLGTKAKLSMESQVVKEHSNILIYELEF